MRILGLDPGSRFTGYGLIRHRGGAQEILAAGRLKLSSDQSLGDRLAALASALDALLGELRPDRVALETLFHGRSARSALVLAHARGVILARLAARRLPVHEYAPAQIKQALTGNGNADKQQVGRMVGLILGVDQRLQRDASDALAIALCCAQRARFDTLAGEVSGLR